MNQAQVGWSTVRHERLRPVRHGFRYPGFFVLLPLRSMRGAAAAAGGIPRNRKAAVSFHDADHGDGRADCLGWLDELLRSSGITDADGEAWLQCFPRVLGFVFKPVSFWFCERADGTLRAVVAEVNNTFGERHCYVLEGVAWGRDVIASKVFHVSPFCEVRGQYRFRFLRSADGTRNVARIDYEDAAGALLQTSIAGQLEPATAASVRRAFWRFPLLTLGIVARIHWHALRLWLARVPVIRHVPRPVAPTR